MATPTVKLRRNIYALSPDDIQMFISKVKALKASKDYDMYVATHADALNVVNLVHEKPLFLPWHRAFLHHFEQKLGLPFGLPYWDWTDDLGQKMNRGPLWQADLWGGAGFPVKDGPFTLANGWETVPATINDGRRYLKFGKELRRGLSLPGSYPTPKDIRNLFVATPSYEPSNYDAFRIKIEFGPHGYMHVWVGGRNLAEEDGNGHMSFFETSVNDPIFWLHHANIDRLWAQWQRLFPKSPVEAFENGVVVMNGDTYMPPVFGKEGRIYVKDVIDLSKLNYTYEAPLQLSAMFRGPKTPGPYIDDDEDFYTISTAVKQEDQLHWPAQAIKQPRHFSAFGPAIVYIHARRETVSVFRQEAASRQNLWTTTQGADGKWTPDSSLESHGQGMYKSDGEPGLTLFKEKLYCVFRGETGDEQLYVTSRGSDGRWSPATTLMPRDRGLYYSNSGAALVVFNDTLYCVHAGASNHDDSLWWSATTDGVNWTPDRQFPKSFSIARPALVVWNERLYCIHRGGRGSDGNLLHWTQLIAVAPTEGETGLGSSSWEESYVIPNHYIDYGPGAAIWEEEEKPSDQKPPKITQLLVCLYRSDTSDQKLKYATAKMLDNGNGTLQWSAEKQLNTHNASTLTSPALISSPLPLM